MDVTQRNIIRWRFYCGIIKQVTFCKFCTFFILGARVITKHHHCVVNTLASYLGHPRPTTVTGFHLPPPKSWSILELHMINSLTTSTFFAIHYCPQLLFYGVEKVKQIHLPSYWFALMNPAINIQVPYEAGNFLTALIGFFQRTFTSWGQVIKCRLNKLGNDNCYKREAATLPARSLPVVGPSPEWGRIHQHHFPLGIL